MKLYDNPYIRYIALLLIYFGTIYYYKDSRTVKGVLYFTALFWLPFPFFILYLIGVEVISYLKNSKSTD